MNFEIAAASQVDGQTLVVLLGDRVILVGQVALVQNTEPTRHDELLIGAQDGWAI